jgi:hypothetical protein
MDVMEALLPYRNATKICLPIFDLEKIIINLRTYITNDFRNKLIFYGEELLAPRLAPKLEDHPLSFVRGCLFNIFAATLHCWRSFLHPQPEFRHVVVTGIPPITHNENIATFDVLHKPFIRMCQLFGYWIVAYETRLEAKRVASSTPILLSLEIVGKPDSCLPGSWIPLPVSKDDVCD